mmetsp:Transcript_466/g.570  ORF Transcript_466/g.570 Transcript_466/m.570 type:complete len:205 (-) Transcript_466:61-675(-)|eukprot:CAMPEP_0174250032 /NCGR_PEP_ID=MMETSP0439-20130205/321_1 /TAXON_ID=0 /ORGANISM="Stereomyxa ramosa, Strain Chinc5" /LENGTH=204 /DNA_ID=CAMNT_0015330001 /DNA_START=72 /DNA_END=686 /DNA_ORIENTATION=-
MRINTVLRTPATVSPLGSSLRLLRSQPAGLSPFLGRGFAEDSSTKQPVVKRSPGSALFEPYLGTPPYLSNFFDPNRMFSNFFNDTGLEQTEMTAWRPRVNVKELDNRTEIEAELPGIKKEDIKLEFKDNSLTIQGETKEEKKEEEEGKFTRIERRSGSFMRRFALPKGVKEHDISASYTDGVLKVTIAKSPDQLPPKPAAIPIS